MVFAPHCLCCEEPLVPGQEKTRLCAKHLAEDKDSYGDLPPVPEGAEVIYLVQVEEHNEDGDTWFQYYETGALYNEDTGQDVVRVELYEGKKARVLLSDGKNEDGSCSLTVYNFPWAKVLHWQEA